MKTAVSKKLFSKKRYVGDWVLERITVQPYLCDERSVYTLTFENTNYVIDFGDFAFLENEITDMFPSASNFCLRSGTLYNPKISFIV